MRVRARVLLTVGRPVVWVRSRVLLHARVRVHPVLLLTWMRRAMPLLWNHPGLLLHPLLRIHPGLLLLIHPRLLLARMRRTMPRLRL